MADYVVANIDVFAVTVDGVAPRTIKATAGVTISAGDVLYMDGTDSKVKDAANTAEASSVAVGIALNNASPNQPVSYISKGFVQLGDVAAAGDIAVVSTSGGNMAPSSDLISTNYVSIIGVFASLSLLEVNINNSKTVKG